MVTIALGGATAAIHDAFPYPPEDLEEADRTVESVALRGAEFALQVARARLAADLDGLSSLLRDQGKPGDGDAERGKY